MLNVECLMLSVGGLVEEYFILILDIFVGVYHIDPSSQWDF